MKQSARGRAAELAVSGRFLEALQSGPRGLVLAGEAGIGKTTLWKQVLAHARARSYWVLSCRPTESETALSFRGAGRSARRGPGGGAGRPARPPAAGPAGGAGPCRARG